MSDTTASIIEAVAASIVDPFKSISSDDMISKTKDYNGKIIARRREKEALKMKKENSCKCDINVDDVKSETYHIDTDIEEENKEEEDFDGLLGEQRAKQGLLIS